MEIREFHPEDLDGVLELESKFPPSSRPRLSRDKALKLHSSNPRCCWVALEGNRILGFIFCQLESTGICHIRYLQVDPEYLGLGIPDKLIQRVIQELNPSKIRFG